MARRVSGRGGPRCGAARCPGRAQAAERRPHRALVHPREALPRLLRHAQRRPELVRGGPGAAWLVLCASVLRGAAGWGVGHVPGKGSASSGIVRENRSALIGTEPVFVY